MGLWIRDDRQMKALTGVSQAQFDFLLPAFSHVIEMGQNRENRKPETGIKGKLTMAALCPLLFAYPTFDVQELDLRWSAPKPMKISARPFCDTRWRWI